MYDASLDLFLQNRSWRDKAQKGISQAYILFSSPRKSNTVQQSYLYVSNFYRGTNFYWNTWNYYGYNFSNQNYYNDYYQYIPEEIQNNTGTYFQVEVRDAKTGAFISNAMIFNFKTAEQVETNEDGFTKILGEKTVLMGVVALGYEEQRLELKKGLTVVHLQPKEDGISETSYDDLFKVKSAWYGIYYHYLNNIADASKSAQDEVRFMEAVIKYDKEIKSSSRDDREADKEVDFKSSRKITGGADKGSKGIGRGEKFIEDENKVVSAVAYTTVTSKTIQ